MLLDRDAKPLIEEPTTAVKVEMVNLPPFVLALADGSGTVYVGGGLSKELLSAPQATYFGAMASIWRNLVGAPSHNR